MTVLYKSSVIPGADAALQTLLEDLAWERRESTPRGEYYCNDHGVPYTYGSGRGVRTYYPRPYHPTINAIRVLVEREVGCILDVCFLNRYDDQRDQLGWHADDSPEMDDTRPIVVVSLGAEREIWFKERGSTDVTKILLGNGSLLAMPPGFQDTHLHRIPKCSKGCGVRVSLTFRGYVAPPA